MIKRSYPCSEMVDTRVKWSTPRHERSYRWNDDTRI